MLPEPLRLLIAAYAADDLSPRRKKAAVRLLKHSREARHLLRGLVADRKRLRTLPKLALPADFADRVASQLPTAVPAVRPSASPARHFSLGHVAAAFSVALAFGIGAWLVLVQSGDGPKGTMTPVAETPRTETPVVVKAPDAVEGDDNQVEPSIPSADPPIPAVPDLPPIPTTKPTPREILTAPPAPKPETVQVKPPRLTLVVPVSGLDAADATAKLTRDFGLGDAHRIDLFARDTPRAFDRLQATLRAKGVRVSVEAVAADAHKRRTRGLTYVLFCEDLTAAEWVGAFRHLGIADRRAEERKAGDGAFEAVALMALAASDQKDLTALLGADVSQPVAKAKAGGVDVRKPVADGTAQQVLDALEKSGRERKANDKVGVVVSGSALRASPTTSREIKQFVEGRRERPAGAIAVMLVLRQAN